jgi:hypothetical protein
VRMAGGPAHLHDSAHRVGVGSNWGPGRCRKACPGAKPSRMERTRRATGRAAAAGSSPAGVRTAGADGAEQGAGRTRTGFERSGAGQVPQPGRTRAFVAPKSDTPPTATATTTAQTYPVLRRVWIHCLLGTLSCRLCDLGEHPLTLPLTSRRWSCKAR